MMTLLLAACDRCELIPSYTNRIMYRTSEQSNIKSIKQRKNRCTVTARWTILVMFLMHFSM